MIQRQDAPAESFFLVLEGQGELSVSGPRGRRVIDHLSPGVVFGAGAALGRRRVATATALTPMVVLEVHIATAASVVSDYLALQRQLEVVAKQRKRRRRSVQGPERGALNRREEELLR